MTLSEFKAWFDGYTENMDETPNKKQWKRIQARVKEIDGQTVTERVYLDRYWPTINRFTYNGPFVATCETLVSGISVQSTSDTTIFNSTTAMAHLGTSDAMTDAH